MSSRKALSDHDAQIIRGACYILVTCGCDNIRLFDKEPPAPKTKADLEAEAEEAEKKARANRIRRRRSTSSLPLPTL